MPLTGPPGVLPRALREDVMRHASSANRVAMILSDPVATSDVAAFCRDHPDVRVTAFWPQEAEPLLDQPENLTCRWTHDLTDVHCVLAGIGPVDLLFESPGTPDDRLMIGYLLWHVRPEGEYVLDSHTRSWRQEWTRADDPDGRLATLVPHLLSDTLGRRPFSQDVRSIVGSIRSATADGEAVRLVRRGEAVIKLRHTQLPPIMATRPNDGWCRVVARKPAGELDAAAVMESTTTSRSGRGCTPHGSRRHRWFCASIRPSPRTRTAFCSGTTSFCRTHSVCGGVSGCITAGSRTWASTSLNRPSRSLRVPCPASTTTLVWSTSRTSGIS